MLIATLHSHYRFASAKQAAARAGLDAHIRDSGTKKGARHLATCGGPLLRKALYMPALVAWRHNPAIKAFCERLKANGKNGKLLHPAFAILTSGKPSDPNYRLA